MNAHSRFQQAQNILHSVVSEAQQKAAALAEDSANILHGSEFHGHGIRLLPQQRTALQNRILHGLEHITWCNGAGFASYAAPTAQHDDYWTLEWWFKEETTIRQAQLERNQETRQRLDFRGFDWFGQPAKLHQPFVEGPYVDYVCNGAYTITAAHPVLLDGAFAGVAAVDILVATLERLLHPALTAIGQPALVVNRDSRVVISAAPCIRVGSLWRGPESGENPHEQARPLRLLLLNA